MCCVCPCNHHTNSPARSNCWATRSLESLMCTPLPEGNIWGTERGKRLLHRQTQYGMDQRWTFLRSHLSTMAVFCFPSGMPVGNTIFCLLHPRSEVLLSR